MSQEQSGARMPSLQGRRGGQVRKGLLSRRGRDAFSDHWPAFFALHIAHCSLLIVHLWGLVGDGKDRMSNEQCAMSNVQSSALVRRRRRRGLVEGAKQVARRGIS